jgi:AAA+ ATPase superfamily predicted ATPase
MLRSTNPFTPAFGSEPLFIAGREQIISDILGGLANRPGDPNRASILVGPRGSGKTVLLTKIATEASQMGWISASVTASIGMLDKILEQVEYNGRDVLPKKEKSRLSEIHAFGVGFSTERVDNKIASWRMQMTRYLKFFAQYEIGIIITVDEIDSKISEMIDLVADFQHFVRERREVALIMAGLPGKTLQMFKNERVSFIRRAFQHELEAINKTDVKIAMRKTIEASGRSIDNQALEVASDYTKGFPFLIQLVGYNIWRQSPDNKIISQDDVNYGIECSESNMENMILDTTVNELSEKDLEFLYAMLPDKNESKISDIIARLGCTPNIASQYRLRLLKQGIIEEYGRGKVQFAMPLLKEYLAKIKHME